MGIEDRRGPSPEEMGIKTEKEKTEFKTKEEIEQMTPEQKAEYFDFLEIAISNNVSSLLGKRTAEVATNSRFEKRSDGRMHDTLKMDGTDGFYFYGGLQGLTWDHQRGYLHFMRDPDVHQQPQEIIKLVRNPKGAEQRLYWRFGKSTGEKDKDDKPIFEDAESFEYDTLIDSSVTDKKEEIASLDRQKKAAELLLKLQTIAESLGNKRNLRLVIERPLEDFLE